MRVITHQAFIDRNRKIANYSFLLSFVALIAGFFFTLNINAQANAASPISCLIAAVMFMGVLFSVRQANNWVRQPLAWEALQQSLRGLPATHSLYHFVYPARHVLVTPNGVYIFFPMFQDRPVSVRDDKWTIPGGLIQRILTFMRQEAVGSPSREAQLEAEQLQKILEKQFPDVSIPVQPVIVFTHPQAQVEIEGEPSVPIVFTYSKQDPSLRDYLRTQKDAGRNTLTPAQLEELDSIFVYQ